MDSQSEKTLVVTPAHPVVGHSAQGWMNGFLGMIIFSGSLPATRVAVLELDPLFLTAVRAAIAALLALCALLITRQARPTRADLPPLLFVALGVVIGFPLLTALALQHTTSAHSLVYIGLLPLATAGFGVLRGGERPKPAFWAFSGIGAALVGAFALSQESGGAWQGDALMIGAVLLCGLGYAEGAVLSRRIGGWQVISWALVVALPLTLVAAWWAAPAGGHFGGQPGQIAQCDLPFIAVFGHDGDRGVFRYGVCGQQRQRAARGMNLSAAAEGMQRVRQLAITRRQRRLLSPQRCKQARAIVDAQLRRQRHGLRPEVPVERGLLFAAVAALVVPQRQHGVAIEAIEGDGLAVARQRLQMAGDGAGVPVRAKAAHRGGVDRNGQPLRFVEQREGDRIIGGPRFGRRAVAHRERQVRVEAFGARRQRRQQMGLGGGVVAIQTDGDLRRPGVFQLDGAVMATAQTQRQAIGFPLQAGGLSACGVHPVDRLHNAGAERVIRSRWGKGVRFHRG